MSQHAAVGHVIHGHAVDGGDVATRVVEVKLVAREGSPQRLASRLGSGHSGGLVVVLPPARPSLQRVRVAHVRVGRL